MMLIIDYDMLPWEVNESIAYYFTNAGYTVEYRRYYPNLVREDIEKYQAIVLLSARTPLLPGGQMSLAEAELVVQFVRKGGLLILGAEVGGGPGYADNERFLFNKVLFDLGINIRIADNRLSDLTNGYAASIYHRPYYKPVRSHPVNQGVADRLVADRCPSLRVGAKASVILTTFDTAVEDRRWIYPDGCTRATVQVPVVATGKAGKGYVVVTSRFLLNSTGYTAEVSGKPLVDMEGLDHTPRFLQNLGNYLRELMEGKAQWVVTNPLPLVEVEMPQPPAGISEASLLDCLPRGIQTITFYAPMEAPDRYDSAKDQHYRGLPDVDIYGWIEREGIRAGWAYITKDEAHIDRLTRAFKENGLNMLWGVGEPQRFTKRGTPKSEQKKTRQQWNWVAQRLDGSSVRWFIGLNYADSKDDPSRAYGAQGQTVQAPSPLSRRFWEREMLIPLTVSAQYALNHPCVAGLIIDLELYGNEPTYNYYMGYGYGDLCYRVFLENVRGTIDEEVRQQLSTLDLKDRFDALRERGLLRLYYSVLESEVERMGRRIRERVHAIHPGLILGAYIFTMPTNWFAHALLRGLSTPEHPILLLTFHLKTHRTIEQLRARGIYAYHASAALMGMFEVNEYRKVFANAFAHNHGYWLNRATSLADTEGYSVLECTPRASKSEVLSAIKDANAYLDQMRSKE